MLRTKRLYFCNKTAIARTFTHKTTPQSRLRSTAPLTQGSLWMARLLNASRPQRGSQVGDDAHIVPEILTRRAPYTGEPLKSRFFDTL